MLYKKYIYILIYFMMIIIDAYMARSFSFYS